MKTERIFADTDLFLRYLTNDIPEKVDAIEVILHRAMDGEIVLASNDLVIAEIVWTLESYYRLARQDIQAKVIAILNTPGLIIANNNVLLQAILWYSEKNVGYIDAYNVAWLLSQDMRKDYTFDRRRFNLFEQIEVTVPGERGN
jgi:predicted nucleic-acid-binding protein